MTDISSDELSRRQFAVTSALASLAIEGLTPDDEAQDIYRRYACGELALAQMGEAINALNDRDYGPVRLSWHEHA